MGEIVRDLIPELIGVGAHAARTCDRESVSQAALHDNREISLATQPPGRQTTRSTALGVAPRPGRLVLLAAGAHWRYSLQSVRSRATSPLASQ